MGRGGEEKSVEIRGGLDRGKRREESTEEDTAVVA